MRSIDLSAGFQVLAFRFVVVERVLRQRIGGRDRCCKKRFMRAKALLFADEETLVLPVPAPECESLQGRGVGDTGGEPEASFPQKTPFSQQGGAESGALSGDDERLRVLLECWAEIPESVKDAVMEMVRG